MRTRDWLEKLVLIKKKKKYRIVEQLRPVLLRSVLRYLPFEEQIRLRRVSRLTNALICPSLPTLPFLLIRIESDKALSIWSSHPSFISHCLYPDDDDDDEYRRGDNSTGSLRVSFDDLQWAMDRIFSRLAGIEHLWLEQEETSSHSSLLLESILGNGDYGRGGRRFRLTRLTGLGISLQQVTPLIEKCSSWIESVRLRHFLVKSKLESIHFWSTIGHCALLRELQYEPCRLDRFSAGQLIDAFEKKRIRRLILTGILDVENVFTMSPRFHLGSIETLCISGPGIGPNFYLTTRKMKSTVGKLNFLLLQLDDAYSIFDENNRDHLYRLLSIMSISAQLCVVQPLRTRRVALETIAFWVDLADRMVKLKLENINQGVVDEALGRLLRTNQVFKMKHSNKGNVSLSIRGRGRMILLDVDACFEDE